MVKKITVYIINFFLAISVFALISLIILSSTILNKQYIKNVFEKKDYYERTYYSIENNFKNHTMQAGVEDNIVEGLYDREKIKNDINMVIEAIYENKEINIDTQTIKQTLDDRINAILEENNRRPDTEEKEAITIFEDAIVETYQDGISYSKEYVEKIGQVMAQILPTITLIKIILSIVVLVLIVAIALINKNLIESIKTFGVTLLTAGILGISIKILIGKRIHNILILNQAFSQSLIELIYSVVNTFFILGIVISIIGIIAIIVSSNKKTQPSK